MVLNGINTNRMNLLVLIHLLNAVDSQIQLNTNDKQKKTNKSKLNDECQIKIVSEKNVMYVKRNREN